MPKEYIERNALINEINKNIIENPNERCAQILEAILYAPAADVAEVVRCKDCKCCEVSYPCKAIGEEAVIGYYCNWHKCYKKPTDFCSYGERKEEK